MKISLLLRRVVFSIIAGCGITHMSTAEEYILDASPGGDLRYQLDDYWYDVKATKGKKQDLTNEAIANYPPHISLTGFFPKELSMDEYIQALEDAVDAQKSKPTINIKKIVQSNKTDAKSIDYISVSSTYLKNVTKAFMKNLGWTKKQIKDYFKDPSSFTYHITLRQKFLTKNNLSAKVKAIHKLQSAIDIDAPATWSLIIYSKTPFPPLKTIIHEIPLET